MLRSDQQLVEHIAHQRGYDLPQSQDPAIIVLTSSLAPGAVWVTGRSPGLFDLRFELQNVGREIRREFARNVDDGSFSVDEYQLYDVLGRAFELSVSLPDEPLQRFRKATEQLPRTTEAERLVVQRVGQDIFRSALEDYWGGRCAITGITERELLRASHIQPWADSTDGERLDAYNGLLLAAHLDAAFDKALITVDPDGVVLFSSRLSSEAIGVLNPFGRPLRLALSPGHQRYLERHRLRFSAEGA